MGSNPRPCENTTGARRLIGHRSSREFCMRARESPAGNKATIDEAASCQIQQNTASLLHIRVYMQVEWSRSICHFNFDLHSVDFIAVWQLQ